MKIFEKKAENVSYTACKYHEDWLISFENIAKRDRSFCSTSQYLFGEESVEPPYVRERYARQYL